MAGRKAGQAGRDAPGADAERGEDEAHDSTDEQTFLDSHANTMNANGKMGHCESCGDYRLMIDKGLCFKCCGQPPTKTVSDGVVSFQALTPAGMEQYLETAGLDEWAKEELRSMVQPKIDPPDQVS